METKVWMTFGKEEAKTMERNLRTKYNQGNDVDFADLCEIAIRREAHPTKVSLIGLDVHKSCTGD